MPGEVLDERLTWRFTFAAVSHADRADWPGGKARSGEGWHDSLQSSRRPSDEREEMGDFVSEISSSLSISRATKLGLEMESNGLTQRHTTIKTTEILPYLRSQLSKGGLPLGLLDSGEAEQCSLARAWSAGDSGRVQGAEGGWECSE